MAAHDRLRRRQGPRARALERRAHLLRLGHRLPPGQARARLRAPDRRVGRRPPRLRAADEGGLRGARRRPGAARAADHAARAPGAARGERAQMSKRAGEFVTLDDLLAEIGVDAARWYLLARSHDTTVDLDLDLAREQSSENPVYYVQYAHARIVSILAKAGEERVRAARAAAAERRARAAARDRARAGRAAARVPGGDRRGGRAARAAPDRGLRARARADVHGLLPRLPRGRRRAGGGRVLAHRAVRGEQAHDRALPGPARGERAEEM